MSSIDNDKYLQGNTHHHWYTCPVVQMLYPRHTANSQFLDMKIKMCKITKYQNVENHILLKQKLGQIEFIRDSRGPGHGAAATLTVHLTTLVTIRDTMLGCVTCYVLGVRCVCDAILLSVGV